MSTKILKQLEFTQQLGTIYQIYDEDSHIKINETSGALSNLRTTVNGHTGQIEVISSNIDNIWKLFPIGTIIAYPATKTDGSISTPEPKYTLGDAWLLCNGAKVNCSDYPALYNALSSTQLYHDLPSGEPGKFNLPNFRYRVPWGYNGNITGYEYAYVQPGLPNIYGKFSIDINAQQNNPEGAFYYGTVTEPKHGASASERKLNSCIF